MAAVFSFAVFLSAFLLFWVQPMVGKIVLPLLGGTPSVWNTCLVFFQVLLLAGYAYAHFLAQHVPQRTQPWVHLAVMLAGFLFLPIALPEKIGAAVTEQAPVIWLTQCLGLMVGVPFFALASNGPLLQRWFSHTQHPSAADPYFLYAASNIGSLMALLAFPLVLEPQLRLFQQSQFWLLAYLALFLALTACAWPRWHAPASAPAPEAAPATGELTATRPRALERAHWTLLALVPSSLLLGVTNYLTTDIASIPLLWIVPLALYLLTFVLAFGRSQWGRVPWLGRTLAVGAIAVLFLMLSRATQPVGLLIALHLLFFFNACWFSHTRLANLRPPANRLTEFYFYVSLGGALGGMFTALIAPQIFRTVVEYPMAIVLVCALRPWTRDRSWNPTVRDFAFSLLLGMFTAVLVVTVPLFDLSSLALRHALILGVPALFCFLFVDRSQRFALALAGWVVGGWLYSHSHGQTLFLKRDFFGISRVAVEGDVRFRRLIHGNTVHGRQFIDPKRACEPLTYYHRTGPLGYLFRARTFPAANIGVVGLGAGSMISYSAPGQKWTFYEIDPVVSEIAQNTNLFSYLGHCGGAPWEIIPGDARLRLRQARNHEFELLVVDAFNSDAIPVHLVTREAIRLYLQKLAPTGWLVFHISNRYLDLEPVMANLAADAGLVAFGWDDGNVNSEEQRQGKEESHWVVMARDRRSLAPLTRVAVWQSLKATDRVPLWTDDFSHVFSVFRW